MSLIGVILPNPILVSSLDLVQTQLTASTRTTARADPREDPRDHWKIRGRELGFARDVGGCGCHVSFYDFRSGRSGDRAIHVVEVAAIGTVFKGLLIRHGEPSADWQPTPVATG